MKTRVFQKSFLTLLHCVRPTTLCIQDGSGNILLSASRITNHLDLDRVLLLLIQLDRICTTLPSTKMHVIMLILRGLRHEIFLVSILQTLQVQPYKGSRRQILTT